MSIAEIWDRFWWSMLITIALGLLWLKFLDEIIPCVSVGLILCIGVGVIYFSIGIRAMVKKRALELEIERKAYEELLAELQEEPIA
jgi:hypothetical protein